MTDNNASWVTDKSWLTGLVGSVSILLIAFWFYLGDALKAGVRISGIQLTNNINDSILFALSLTGLMMFGSECLRLYLRDKDSFIQIHPHIRGKQYGAFFRSCFIRYIEALIVLWLIIVFFQTAGEYGFRSNTHFYQPWFRLLNLAWTALQWAGLPYIVLTHGFKHSGKKYSIGLFDIVSYYVLRALKIQVKKRTDAKAFNEIVGKSLRDLLVKVIFAPLVTVFFASQFSILVNHLDYIFNGLSSALEHDNYLYKQFNIDLANISLSLILSINFALAWCGYLLTSCWLDNHFVSSDPKLRGWVVCMLSYPPFKLAAGWFFAEPQQLAFLTLQNQYVVTLLIFFFISFFTISTIATVCFGIRFSNMTNRGIVRKGPFAWVRHPEYAAKTLALWITGIPFIVFQIDRIGLGGGLSLLAGLGIITWVYYWRALTEEEHLSQDPQYADYCKNTPYRFIPGVV
jgi:protein-S-isoprenylcysteine O-methyltransferase Ste14